MRFCIKPINVIVKSPAKARPALLERRPDRKTRVDLLTAFGLATVAAMLTCYALEERTVEAIWGAVALRRFVRRRAVA